MVVAATAAYNTEEFVRAAAALEVEVDLGTDRCHILAEAWWAEGAVALDFRDPVRAAAQIVEHAAAAPIHGLVATDERTSMIVALAAEALGLRGNPPAAVRAAWNKSAFRDALRAAGLRQPDGCRVEADADLASVARAIGYPLVIKPLHLSGSRGVMRVDDPVQLRERGERLRRLLADPEVAAVDPEAAQWIALERYVEGAEVAVEGLLADGELTVLAVFDKPDPLEGPFFAETIYVTAPVVDPAIAEAVAAAARAIGLREGPVHAEVRRAAEGPVVLELAARSIGGLCARTLRFDAGVSLEELVIRHALGQAPPAMVRTGAAASGVFMLPVTEAGVLRAIDGVDRALSVAHVTDVVISARVGDNLSPLPEGRSYLGFVFAAGDDAAEVTAALRQAAQALSFRIAPRLSA